MPDATFCFVRCLGLLLAMAFSLQNASSCAQNLPLHLTPSPAQPNEVRGAERRLLARFERLLDQAQWQDALQVAEVLLDSDSSTVVAVDDRLYISLQTYCQRRLTKLPKEILVEYRALIDAPAEAWYRQAIAGRDEQLLQQILDEAFCSSWGDDALNALGEISLQRGEFLAARNYWTRIHSSLHHGLDSTRLIYPDSELSLAEIQARLILVSIREGNFDRAQRELENLAINHGQARGVLGGSEVNYVEYLEKNLEQARSWSPAKQATDWPTYAGSPDRTYSRQSNQSLSVQQIWTQPLDEEDQQKLNIFPVIKNNLVIFQGTSKIQALHLDTGQQAFASQSATFQSPSEVAGFNAWPFHPLAASNRYVFGTTVKNSENPSTGSLFQSLLWGIDLKRDGALSIRKQPQKDEGFAGAPLVVGSHMFVIIRSTDHPKRARATRMGIACYDLATDRWKWQHWLCQSQNVRPGSLKQWTKNLLTYNSGIIFCCTNTGAITALRASDGQILWLRTYDRTIAQTGVDDQLGSSRLPNPCIFDQGKLFVAPTDSDQLLALQADSGELHWQNEMTSLSGELIGASAGKLLLSDRGPLILESQTGQQTSSTNLSNLKLFGQPAITQNVVFWPGHKSIELFDLITGKLLNQAVPWEEQGGANLAIASDYLIAVGRAQISAFRFNTISNENIPEQPTP